MAHDVFLSYSQYDKTIALAVLHGLESAGIRCWIAPRDIVPGSDWAGAIVQGIDQARVMVVIFSENSNKSRHVHREVERAMSKDVIIIPFRIENITPSGAMEYFISSEHWLDAITTPLEQHIQHLSQSIRLLLSQPPEGIADRFSDGSVLPSPEPPAAQPSVATTWSTQPSSVSSPTGQLQAKPNRMKLVILIILALAASLVIITLGYILYTGMQSSNRGNSDIEKSQVGETSASQTTSNFGITETPAQQVAFSTEFIEPTQSRPTPYISPPGLTASWQSLPDLPRAVNTFLIDPSDKSVVYAGTGDYSGSGSGVFKSIDAGKTWTPASNGLPNEQALVLASSGQPGTPLFVAIGSQIYRSLDGAQSWEPLGDAAIFPSYEPIELIVMPDSQRLFTAATGGGVTRSEDGGNTWLPSNDGLPKQSDIDRTGITAMARDPVDENILYVGIGGFVGQGAGVYKSVDGGLSWQPANRRILDQRITALAVSPNDSQVIYAGSDRGELFKSIDGGENWMDLTNRIRGLQFWDPRQIRKILINPSTSEQVVMLGDAAGIMVSDDAGESWQSLGQIGENDQPMFTSMAVFFDEGQTMLVGIDRDGAWRRALGPALVIQPTGTSQSSPQATSENALHPTGSWQALEDLPSAVNSFVMNSGNLDVFMAGAGSYSQAGGIYLSSDLGLTWSSAPNWTRTEAIMALANTQISPPITYAATNASQIYSSMDNGENWTLLGNYGLSTYSECHLYITPNDGNFTLFLVASGSGLTRSQDGGYSWQLLKQGLPSNEDYVYAQSLAIDPENPNIVYLGTGGFVGQGYGIYKSTDGGDSWFPSNQGMLDRRITAMAIDPADANTIFAGSDQGELYKSNDGGQSWSDLSELLKGQAFWDPRQIRKILFDPGAPGTIYLLADASGIFYSLNGGASWRLLGKPGEEDYPMFTDMAVNFGLQPIILVGMQDKGAWRYGQMD